MRRTLLGLVLLLSACGGDDDGGGGGGDQDGGGDDGADAGGDQPDGGGDPAACTFQSAAAIFTVSSSPEAGGVSGSVADVPFPWPVEEKDRVGECAFHGASFCDPVCEDSTICSAGACSPFPTNEDAGTVEIAGTDPPLELEPQPGPSYYTTENHPDLYQAGDLLTLTGGGGDSEVPAFEATARGVPVLELPTTMLTATEGEDMVVEWDTAGDSPEGAAVVLHMDSDHHGSPAYIECIAADDGELTVAAELIDAIIAAGESGIGTYIENAYMLRMHAGTDDLGGGDCLLFHTESRQFVSVETVLDE